MKILYTTDLLGDEIKYSYFEKVSNSDNYINIFLSILIQKILNTN